MVKKINDQIDGLAATKKQFADLVDILAKSPGVAPTTVASLRQQADEMDCLRFLKTADGERQFKAFSQLFKEVKVRVLPGGKQPTYRLLRLEKILR